ncbi:MAG: hypothetical protein DMF62_16210 [Acidobacteria bacterium]|nr:MAG: hypothetical protein DMF62_16210 [Acidobacteriota bacterium]
MSNKNIDMNQDLKTRLETVCRGLVFVSETDSEVVPFFGTRTNSLNAEGLLAAAGMNDGRRISVIRLEEFFDKLSREREWHSDIQINNARGFRALKLLLASELSDLMALKIGEINIELVLIGLDKEGYVAGVKMRAIET